MDKGQEKINVDKEATAIEVADLKRVPEGYQVVGEVTIDGRFATAIVEPVKTTKLITVNYKTSTGMDKGQEKITVAKEATTIAATDLKRVPEGYKVVGEVTIDGRFATAIVEPIEEAPAFRYVRVEYVDAAGTTVVAKREKIEYGKLTYVATAPEGYDLFDTNNVISIDDETTLITVEVRKHVDPQPEFRFVRVEYVDASGAKVSTKREKIEYGKLTYVATAPEGYDLFDTNNVISIDDETTLITVEVRKHVDPQPEFRFVRVEYVDASGAKVSTKREKIEYGKLTYVATAPEGYDLFDTNNVISIDDETTLITVEVRKHVEAPAFRFVRVNYVDAAGRTVANSRVKIEYGKLTFAAKAPEGYDLFDTNNVISIDDETTVINVQVRKHVEPQPEAPEFRMVRVNYKDAASRVIETRLVKIEFGKLTFTAKAPEGYDLFDTNNVISIDDETKVINVEVRKHVEPQPEFRFVRVNYVDAAGRTIEAKREKIEYGKLTYVATAPEGYTLFDTNNVISIDDETTTITIEVRAIEEPTDPAFRFVRVNYVDAAGRTIVAKREKIEYGKLTYVATAPEGYTLFDTNNVISIDDETTTITIEVRAIEEPSAPEFRFVRVNYVDAAGRIIEAKREKIEYGKLVYCATAPEGYTLFDTNNVISIDDETTVINIEVRAIEDKEEVLPETPVDPEEKPEIDVVPQTGDSSNIVMLSATSLSALGLALVAASKKSKKNAK